MWSLEKLEKPTIPPVTVKSMGRDFSGMCDPQTQTSAALLQRVTFTISAFSLVVL